MIKRNLLKLFFVLHSLSMSMGWKCRSWPPHFSVHNFLSVNILSLVFYMTYRSWFDYLFQTVACFYTAEQCSAINNLSIVSALEFSKSGLCNLKLCVTLGGMQKVL